MRLTEGGVLKNVRFSWPYYMGLFGIFGEREMTTYSRKSRLLSIKSRITFSLWFLGGSNIGAILGIVIGRVGVFLLSMSCNF